MQNGTIVVCCDRADGQTTRYRVEGDPRLVATQIVLFTAALQSMIKQRPDRGQQLQAMAGSTMYLAALMECDGLTAEQRSDAFAALTHAHAYLMGVFDYHTAERVMRSNAAQQLIGGEHDFFNYDWNKLFSRA